MNKLCGGVACVVVWCGCTLWKEEVEKVCACVGEFVAGERCSGGFGNSRRQPPLLVVEWMKKEDNGDDEQG